MNSFYLKKERVFVIIFVIYLGCTCPEGQYMDTSDPNSPRCTLREYCPCFDSYTRKFYEANQIIRKGCANW